MTGFASTQRCEPGRARMNIRFSVQEQLCAEARRYTALWYGFSRGEGISRYFNVMPRHAAMRMMSCFDADLRR